MESDRSHENKMIRDAIRDWVIKECPRDKIEEWDAADRYPDVLTRNLSRLGFCAITVSEEGGGEGRNIEGACIVAEEIAARFQPLARWYTHQALMGGLVIETMGSRDQQKKLLPGCAKGTVLIAPAGMDGWTAAMQKDPAGGEPSAATFRLSGEAAHVTLADQARFLLIPARAGHEDRSGEVTVFLAPTDRPGLSITPVEKIGCRGARYCRVELADVVLETGDILGGSDTVISGAAQWQKIVDLSRLMTAAEALGLARGAFDYTLNYARQRTQFGQVIGRFTALRNRFAEMSCDIDAAAMLVARAARNADLGRAFQRDAAAARIKAGAVAMRCAMEGLQIFGGYGYTMEYDIQRYVRDAAGLSGAADGEESARAQLGSLLGL